MFKNENNTFWTLWNQFVMNKSVINNFGDLNLSDSCRLLINRMLSYNPEDRPTFRQLELDTEIDPTLSWLSRSKGNPNR